MLNFITALSVLLWILLRLKGGQALSCSRCVFRTSKYQCLQLTDDTVEVCAASVQTCVVATGLEKVNGKWSPIMTRRCSTTAVEEMPHDPDAFKAVAEANGEKIFCMKLQRKLTGPDGQPLTDIRCLCAEEKCNGMTWDEAMQLPSIPKRTSGKYTPADKPVREPLGNNSLANTEKTFNDKPPSGNISINPGDPGSGEDKTPDGNSLSTTKAGNASNTETSAAPEAESGKGKGGSGGSNTGLIAGVVAGLLTLLAAAGGGLWWFLAQRKKKKKKKGSDDTGGSNDSDESGGSGGSGGDE